MAVDLLIEYSDRPSILVPVATNQIFRESWEPLCSQLGLQLVPLFIIGLDVDNQNISLIIEELERLDQYVQSGVAHLSGDLTDYMHERIIRLIRELGNIINDPVISATFS